MSESRIVISDQKPDDPCFEGDKRQRAAVVLELQCKCGEVSTIDYTGGSYFSYPTMGTPFKHEMWCQHCEEETSVMLTLNVQVTLHADSK